MTGCDRRSSRRTHGYSVRGKSPRNHRILIRGIRYSVISVIALEGILDFHIVQGKVNGDRFGAFVTDYFVSLL